MPLPNEVVVTGLPYSPGGTTYAGEDFVIPISGPNGSALTTANFYVDSYNTTTDTDGPQIEVDPKTAAELYATAVALNNLNLLYGPGEAYIYPAKWQNTISQVQIDLAGENLLNLAEGLAPLLVVAFDPAVDVGVAALIAATGKIETVVSTFQQVGETEYANNLEIATAYSYLNAASEELADAEQSYNDDIFPNMDVPGSGITNSVQHPINYNTIVSTYTNTEYAVNAGQAAANEIKTLTPSLSEVLANAALSALNAVTALFPPSLTDLVIGDAEFFVGLSQVSSPSEFVNDLTAAVTTAGDTVEASSPFYQIAQYENQLAASPAETQGAVPAAPSTPIPQPSISTKGRASTTIDTPLSLSSLFTPGTNDPIAYYKIINTLEGPGDIVINNLVYTQAEVPGQITPAEFNTAYFIGPQAGTDEIDVEGFDSAGHSSNIASSLITTAVAASTSSSSDLKVTSASLATQNLVAGGGGTVLFSVDNLGAVAAPNTAFSQIYLSNSTTLNSGDILVSPGSIPDAGLAAGASQSEQLPFSLPNYVVGSYYLIVFAGDSNQVATGASGQTYAIPITATTTSPQPSPSQPVSSSPSGPNPISIATDNAITTRVGSEPEIASSALRATDSQFSNDADLVYTVVTPPSYGRLIDDFYNTSTFTQEDIDNELVDYVQNGSSVSSDSFTFYVTDPGGYRSPTETFTFSILPALSSPPPAPEAPFVTAELEDNTGLPIPGGYSDTTSDAMLTGTANPGATVDLTVDSNATGSVIADASGNWSYSPIGLSQGGHNIAASVTISGQTATYYLNFVYDTVVPPAPSTPQLALGGNLADTATPTFAGTAEANDEVLLLEGSTVVGTGIVTPGGTWTIETSGLSLGYHSISAEAIDPAGNVSSLSGADTVEVVPPPPGEVTLNDAAMIAAGDLSSVGSVNDGPGASITEYGPIIDDGFTLTDQSRAGFSFISWTSNWALLHEVSSVAEYYDGPEVLIVPTNGIINAGGGDYSNVASATPDTIDLKQTNGSAFSLVSIDIGPTGDYPTSAIFTGTTAAGQTITETFELNLPQNSPLQPVALTGFNDVTNVTFTEQPLGNSGSPTSIEFDNIVVGSATTPPSQRSGTLTAPVTLDDAALASADEIQLISTTDNVFSQSTYTDYGPITADGFAITNLDRADYAFYSYDSSFASVESEPYDGPDVLSVPIGQNFTDARVEIQRQDGSAFGVSSIELDTPASSGSEGISVTFTGTQQSGGVVTQSFQLDNTQGFQTFEFGASFDDLSSLQFVGSATNPLVYPTILFDDITLTAPNVPGPPITVIQTDGSTSLAAEGNNYFLFAVNTTTGPELTFNGAGVTVGEFTGWTPIAGVQTTGGGYEVVWQVPSSNQFSIWTTNSQGNETSSSGAVTGSSSALFAAETLFNIDFNGDSTIGAPPPPSPTLIKTVGTTDLDQSGSNYYLFAHGTTNGPELSIGGTPAVTGEFGAYAPIAAVAITGGGYEVVWQVPSSNQFSIWTTNSQANETSSSGAVTGSSSALFAAETLFNIDFNGDSTIGTPPPPSPTLIKTVGTTDLDQSGSNYYLFAHGTTNGPELGIGGTPAVTGEFGAYAPIAAVAITGGGYEVVWQVPSSNQFSIWTTNSQANETSSSGAVTGSSSALFAAETLFNIDFNGDSTIGTPPPPSPTLIKTVGTTDLDQSGSNYYLFAHGTTNGPELGIGGTPAVTGEFGAYAPIAAVAITGGGYEVVWQVPSSNQFSIWTTNSQGNETSSSGAVTGSSSALFAAETLFNIDFNGDSTIGAPPPTVIKTVGSTDLDQVANNYFLYAHGTTTGPELSFGGTPVTAGQFVGWTPIAGVQTTGGGYEVVWQVPSSNQFSIWTTNSQGNETSSSGAVTGSSSALFAAETLFNIDFNGDGTTGTPPPTVIKTVGSTDLDQAGNNYFLYAHGTTTGPELSLGGTPVTAGEFAGGWTPIAGVQTTGGGYEVVWQVPNSNQFSIWTTNSQGNETSSSGAVAGSSSALFAAETLFNIDFNGDAVIGASSGSGTSQTTTIPSGTTVEIASAYSGKVTFAGSTGTLKIDQSSTFSGTVAGMTGQDTIDFADINSNTAHTNYVGTSSGGALTVTDGTHTANIALLGNYQSSTFVPSSDGSNGTNVVDPLLIAANQQTGIAAPPHV